MNNTQDHWGQRKIRNAAVILVANSVVILLFCSSLALWANRTGRSEVLVASIVGIAFAVVVHLLGWWLLRYSRALRRATEEPSPPRSSHRDTPTVRAPRSLQSPVTGLRWVVNSIGLMVLCIVAVAIAGDRRGELLPYAIGTFVCAVIAASMGMGMIRHGSSSEGIGDQVEVENSDATEASNNNGHSE